MAEYNLLLALDTDNPEFARGVEVGTTWTELEAALQFGIGKPGLVLKTQMHSSNEEMARRMAAAKELVVKIRPLEESPGWIQVAFERGAP